MYTQNYTFGMQKVHNMHFFSKCTLGCKFYYGKHEGDMAHEG